MKIIAGISNAQTEEELKAYIDAGVDEFFVGYVPKEWSDVYGWEVSCNRREHSGYHYFTRESLAEVVQILHKYDKKVFLTLNAHEYNQKQLDLLLKIINDIDDIPLDAFIISNLALMLTLRKKGIDKTINISIGSGCNTFESILFYHENIPNIGRFILPRKVTMKEIEDISVKSREEGIKLEAFGMSDPCHFNDEYCFTWHGSMQPSLCQSPMYEHKKISPIVTGANWKQEMSKFTLHEYYKKKTVVENKIKELKTSYNHKHPHYTTEKKDTLDNIVLLNRLGKCGVCAFEKFKDFGIDAVKLPLRGHHMEGNLALIKLTRQVIDKKNATPDYCRALLKAPLFCSGMNCYYNYPYTN